MLQKCIEVFTKRLRSTTVFNTDDDDNKKCLLHSKSAYYNDFWKIMWHRL